ncbi:MAG: phosphatidylglycerol lysyltransferase domain-containing protein [Thermodesulfobacteriota bacterium]
MTVAFKPLALGHRLAIEACLATAVLGISEMTFTNLFAWRHQYQPHIAWLGEHLLVRIRAQGQEALLPPAGPTLEPEVYRAAAALLAAEGRPPVFERVPAPHAEVLADQGFQATPCREHFDYLYRRHDLAELPGRRFMDKRNHIHIFSRENAYRFRTMTPADLPACRQLLDAWCSLKGCADDLGLANEERAIRETLAHFQDLTVTGGVIEVAGRVEAFSLGEPLSPDTVVIHFEKANPAFRGLYQTINRDFCREAWSEYAFVNREQDLGLAGLRQAKESYNPVALVAKYRVQPG